MIRYGRLSLFADLTFYFKAFSGVDKIEQYKILKHYESDPISNNYLYLL